MNSKMSQINHDVTARESIVRRYLPTFRFFDSDEQDTQFKEIVTRLSHREGVRLFHLMDFEGVEIWICDETSFMSTHTIKSIDGCITGAHSILNNYSAVVFESGGNTGNALSAYLTRGGVETFLFIPEENLCMLDASVFDAPEAHLIGVADPGSVKKAAEIFRRETRLPHIPKPAWRHQASQFRGQFYFEQLLAGRHFEWFAQTVSAGFGPIGIYAVLEQSAEAQKRLPRFLGVQQKMNSPMYQSMTKNGQQLSNKHVNTTGHLLSRVMYDSAPQSYGTFDAMKALLQLSNGRIITIDPQEYAHYARMEFAQKDIIRLLRDNTLRIHFAGTEVLEKTGLLAFFGTIKEIENGTIKPGEKVVCSITGGVKSNDRMVSSDYVIHEKEPVEQQIKKYIAQVRSPALS